MVLLMRILGPVEAEVDGRALALGRRRERCLLAVLLARLGQVVSTEDLIELLWGEDAPDSARRSLHAHVARLRRALADTGAELTGTAGGYLIRADPQTVDAYEFRALVQAARRSPVPVERARLLRRALDLWRGDALAELSESDLRTRICAEWDELRTQAVEERILADLDAGADDVVAELRGLVTASPSRERPVALLMLALYRTGRRAEALDAYQDNYRHLVAALGVEPGRMLDALHTAMLRDDPILDAPAQQVLQSTAAGPAAVPQELPSPVTGFAGRAGQLAELDRVRAGPVIAIVGAGGVGKTTLAVHWAHHVRAEFPDGQLYVNLRGFDPDGRPVAPGEALRGFLDALGVPAERIPAGVAGQAGLFRSLLADRRMLVLLDNARDAEQVRPLLPGTAGSLVVLTSRSQLTSLVATHGTQPLALDLLTEADARELLARRLGEGRLAAEPTAVTALIRACARLPLALAVAAARLRYDDFPIAAVVAELADAAQRWAALDAGEPATQVQAVLSWSYTVLPPDAAHLFRLLGLHPGPEISVASGAALAGRPAAETQRLLTTLRRASMLVESAPGRYAFHDLLRAFAADLGHRHDDGASRQTARGRLLDHYVATACAADHLLNPARNAMVIRFEPTTPECFADYRAAADWLTVEQPVLLAALPAAADHGFEARAWQLAWALHTHLVRRGDWAAGETAWRAALPCAVKLGHLPAQGLAHRLLGYALTLLLRYDEALDHLAAALTAYTEAGDQSGLGDTEYNISLLWSRQQIADRALQHAEHALAAYRLAGHRSGQAYALNSVGWHSAQLGDRRRGLDCCGQALELFREARDATGEAATWDSIGFFHSQKGDPDSAEPCYRRALDLFREQGDRYNEADVLNHLAEAQRAMGRTTAARDTWTAALDILLALDHPDAGNIRTALADLDQSGRTTGVGEPATHVTVMR
ncbi:BTAD domain-containing putative transcriptional regulator [Paractinoplanes durhamensis]